MITDADRARICEAMGNGWRWFYSENYPGVFQQWSAFRTEAEFVLAVQKHFRVSCLPSDLGVWVAYVSRCRTMTAETPEQAIPLAALAVLDAKGPT